MKVALALILVAAGIAVANATLCLSKKDACDAETECCLKFGPAARCHALKKRDEMCEMKPGKQLFPDHVYRRMCPCEPGLKCVAKDGIIGKLVGTCQDDSSEVPEPEEE